MKNINDHLTDDCLLHIFDRIQVTDLLSYVGLVCPRWATLQVVAIRRRHSLTLLVGPEAESTARQVSYRQLDDQTAAAAVNGGIKSPTFSFGSSVLKLNTLKAENVKALISAMPYITKLEMVFVKTPSITLRFAIPLFKSLSSQLVHLNIWTSLKEPSSAASRARYTHISAFFSAINGLSRLRYFAYQSYAYVLPPEGKSTITSPQLHLSVLSQLHEFYFNTTDSANILYRSLKKYATGNVDLRAIGILNGITEVQPLVTFITGLDHQLADRFIQLEVDMCPPVFSLFTAMTRQFTSLTTLSIFIDYLSMAQLAHGLLSLKQLVHFKLHDDNIYHEPRPILEKKELASIPQIPSVQQLSLCIFLRSHDHLSQYHLPHIFPNITVINCTHIYYIRCYTCNLHNSNIRPGYRWLGTTVVEESTTTTSREMACFRKCLRPLKKCTQLRRLFGYYLGMHGGGDDSSELNIEDIEMDIKEL